MLDELVSDEQSDAERELAPSVDVPEESDADPHLQRQFWVLVLVFNVALMAASVGAMLAVFRGQWDTGGSLVAAGAILTGYGYYKYRAYTAADPDAAVDEAGVVDADADADADVDAGAADEQ